MSIPDIPILYKVVRFWSLYYPSLVLTPFLIRVTVLNRNPLGCSSNFISNLWSLPSSSFNFFLMRQGRSCGRWILWITRGFLSVSPFFFLTSHSSFTLEACKTNSFLSLPFLDEYESYSTPVSAATAFLFSLVSNGIKTTFLPVLGVINSVLRACVVWNPHHASLKTKSNCSFGNWIDTAHRSRDSELWKWRLHLDLILCVIPRLRIIWSILYCNSYLRSYPVWSHIWGLSWVGLFLFFVPFFLASFFGKFVVDVWLVSIGPRDPRNSN